MKFNLFFVIGVSVIAMFVGVSIALIGETLPSEPFTWWFPLLMAGFLGNIFLFGYLANNKE